MSNKDLIVIEQLPIITEQLATLGELINDKIAYALSLECTEDTVKSIKATRAELTAELTAFEDKRKEVKKAILAPYEAFESVYKQFVSDKYKEADAKLKGQIDAVESRIKKDKLNELKLFYDEYCQSRNINFVPIDRWNPNVTLSATAKNLKEQAKAFVDKICDDLSLIDTQEHKAEILVEYRRTLNVSQAITSVSERHKAIEDMKRREAEMAERKATEQQVVERAQPFAPPKPVEESPPDPVMTLTFKVTAPVSKLKELKKFIVEGGYKYE